MKKRYHICWHGILEMWQCHDTSMDVYGFGKTTADAWANCQFELELATSDIHK